MVGILEFFDAPFFHSSVSVDTFAVHWICGIVYKLHSMTGSLLFLCSCFVFVKELLHDHIHCLQDGVGESAAIDQEGFDSYCYISATFTLPRNHFSKEDFAQLPHAGVGPLGTNQRNEMFYHNYYQWVPYLLFIQSLSFFMPRVLHSLFQGGRVQRVMQDLHNAVVYIETREDYIGDVAYFLKDYYFHNTWWALKMLFCDALNLVNILVNIFLVDWYLGQNFLSYGFQSLGHIFTHPSKRGPDPFDLIFPKMTKCSLERYGPSGTVQNFDSLCVMTVNVLNEKIYFLIWFVFLFLGAFTLIHHLVGGLILAVGKFRKNLLLFYVLPEKKEARRKLVRLLDMVQFGDWMLMYMVAKNTDRLIFTGVVEQMFYPDYDLGLEPLDRENQQLMRSRPGPGCAAGERSGPGIGAESKRNSEDAGHAIGMDNKKKAMAAWKMAPK